MIERALEIDSRLQMNRSLWNFNGIEYEPIHNCAFVAKIHNWLLFTYDAYGPVAI